MELGAGSFEDACTAALGGHRVLCLNCDFKEDPSCNSCRNRHCPKCQVLAQERWISTLLKLARSTLGLTLGLTLILRTWTRLKGYKRHTPARACAKSSRPRFFGEPRRPCGHVHSAIAVAVAPVPKGGLRVFTAPAPDSRDSTFGVPAVLLHLSARLPCGAGVPECAPAPAPALRGECPANHAGHSSP